MSISFVREDEYILAHPTKLEFYCLDTNGNTKLVTRYIDAGRIIVMPIYTEEDELRATKRFYEWRDSITLPDRTIDNTVPHPDAVGISERLQSIEGNYKFLTEKFMGKGSKQKTSPEIPDITEVPEYQENTENTEKSRSVQK